MACRRSLARVASVHLWAMCGDTGAQLSHQCSHVAIHDFTSLRGYGGLEVRHHGIHSTPVETEIHFTLRKPGQPIFVSRRPSELVPHLSRSHLGFGLEPNSGLRQLTDVSKLAAPYFVRLIPANTWEARRSWEPFRWFWKHSYSAQVTTEALWDTVIHLLALLC